MGTLPQSQTTQHEIRKVIAEREAAIRDRDARRVVQVHTADTVIFDLAPPLRLKGSDALDPKALEDWFATWAGPIGLTRVAQLDVRVHQAFSLVVRSSARPPQQSGAQRGT